MLILVNTIFILLLMATIFVFSSRMVQILVFRCKNKWFLLNRKEKLNSF